jgi:hypothetical protein
VARVDDVRRDPERRALLRHDALGRPVRRRRAARRQHRDAPVPEPVQVLEHHADAGTVVEQHLADGRSRQRVADGDDREHLADLGPRRVRRVERRDHEPVDELVRELAREHPLAVGLAARVDDDHVQVVAAELAPEPLDEALLAEVLERSRQYPDQAGAAAGERARDRVAGVAELVGRLAHALLRLRRRLDAAHRVRHGGGRQPGRGGDVLDGDALPRSHASTVAARLAVRAERARAGAGAPALDGVRLNRFSEPVQ